MLRNVAAEMDKDLPEFDSILEFANDDLLQVAEYLYLKSDRHIGPIRHLLERGLAADVDPTVSGSHVELVNLGAPQIYTTNYDDILERTYKQLGVPASSVVLPKDVALADTTKTQIVKYHGDLKHEDSLVLTESSYYRRLDFESPMDLKFRSDLLGRSVLFMGYSFRDINIRVIWFKLLEMMKDVPEADRTPSYIVRTQPNPVLEELYRAVGLRTIVLSDSTEELSPDEISSLHGEFLMRLVDGPSPDASRNKHFVSAARLDRIERSLEEIEIRHARVFRAHAGPGRRALITDMTSQIELENIPAGLLPRARKTYLRLLATGYVGLDQWEKVTGMLQRLGPAREITEFFAFAVASGGQPKYRDEMLNSGVHWPAVWSRKISDSAAKELAERLQEEVEYNLRGSADEDVAYAVDVAKRVLSGEIYNGTQKEAVRESINDALQAIVKIYPAVADYHPKEGARPDPQPILAQVERRVKSGDVRTVRGNGSTQFRLG